MSATCISQTPPAAGLRLPPASLRGLAAAMAAAAAGLVLSLPAPASAATACGDLRARMATLSASRDGGEIDDLRARMAAAGCNGFSAAAAAPLDAGAVATGGDAAAPPVIAVQAQPQGERPDKFFRKLFPFFFKPEEAPPPAAPKGKPRVLAPPPKSQPKTAVGTPHKPVKPDASVESFRTFCVRSCDGYYYQIGRATQTADFARDQAACNNSCPASPTELFVMRNNDPKATELTSLAGVPYSRTPSAFRFRTETTARCTCGTARPISDPAGAAAAGLSVPGAPGGGAAVPAAAVNQTPAAPESAVVKPVVATPPLRVRTVGPTFLQDQ